MNDNFILDKKNETLIINSEQSKDQKCTNKCWGEGGGEKSFF